MNFIKDYFSFNNGERNGILALFIILLLLLIAPYFLDIITPKSKTDFTEFDNQVSAYLANLENEKKHQAKIDSLQKRSNYSTFKNKKYKSKKYHSAYKKTEYYTNKKGYKKDDANYIVDVNKADSTDLTKVKGIGPVLSSRIIKYRDLLGGYPTISQIKEVYGMDSIRFQELEHSFSLSDSIITKMNINEVSKKILYTHPYIDYKIANSIINYRKQHGKYQELREIKKSYLITDEIFSKIAPYLTI
ncbi:MAG: helix-hairpin-helix domain-containing protein [Bacteroidia bacterium]|nr:helix-hairpin-helix domain-containing protein [Bacteroidia bacterium]